MRFVKYLLVFVVHGVVFTCLGVLTLILLQQKDRPELKPWHLAELEAEFTAEDADRIRSLADYLRLEDRLFGELQKAVYGELSPGDRRALNRFNGGSLSDPRRQPTNWNRTFVLPAEEPRGGALLLHGMSDSPYSLRAIGELLNEQGFTVVGLRLPGHGTAPAGLIQLEWQDMAAATRIAAQSLQASVGTDTPLLLVGYSNGAALAVEYSLSAMAGEDVPMPSGLVLISPAIGVTPVAALAVWQSRLARLTGLEKLAWTDIQPEFDPFKYNSFAVNAGDQVYRLTGRINELMAAAGQGSEVTGFPPVLAFQSVVDATVTADALIGNLFQKLAPEGHQLVLFDINRHAESEDLLTNDPENLTQRLLSREPLRFELTLITNEDEETDRVEVRRKPALTSILETEALGLSWPRGIFSQSHVSLPFAPTDPIYGLERESEQSIYLGRLELLGEKNILLMSSDTIVRLRYNPFFSYMERRLLDFIERLETDYVRLSEHKRMARKQRHPHAVDGAGVRPHPGNVEAFDFGNGRYLSQ
jgi:alpha-beta hydrolase superfamily lysophospholipase